MNRILRNITMIAEFVFCIMATIFIVIGDYTKATFFMVLYLCGRVAVLSDAINKINQQ